MRVGTVFVVVVGVEVVDGWSGDEERRMGVE